MRQVRHQIPWVFKRIGCECAGSCASWRALREDWSLPVVWNNHSSCTPEALALLHGVVDIYVPDLKYRNNDCGYRWSGVQGYFDVARQTIDRYRIQADHCSRVGAAWSH